MSEKNLPNSIKIGYYTYTIKKSRNIVNAIGFIDTDHLTIEIAPNYPEQITKETLLHECLHGLLAGTFLVDDDTEEKLVDTLSTKLMGLFTDNPYLLEYLFGVKT